MLQSSLLLPSSWRKNGWSWWHVALGVALTGLTVYATGDAWRGVVADGGANGALLAVLAAPIGAAGLGWVRRHRLQSVRPSHGLPGVVVFVAGLVLYGLGQAPGDAPDGVARVGVALTVLGMAAAYLGTAAWSAFLPVTLLLATLVPAVWLTDRGPSWAVAALLCGQLGLAWAGRRSAGHAVWVVPAAAAGAGAGLAWGCEAGTGWAAAACVVAPGALVTVALWALGRLMLPASLASGPARHAR